MIQDRDRKLDPITLEIYWNRLISIVDQAAAVLQRTAFSPLIRETRDMFCGLLDTSGASIADNPASLGSFAGVLSRTAKHFLRHFPQETWRPGDIVLTNDPWLGTGHRNDVVFMAPVFYKGRLVAFAGSEAHWSDIGGLIWGTSARSVHEEGLGIPPMKLFSEGKPNDTLLEMIRYNSRAPDEVMGDLFAQVGALEVCDRMLVEFLEQYDLSDLKLLSHEIQTRAETAMRAAIRKVPDGTYCSTINLDGFEGFPLKIECAITVSEDEIEVDYGGTSGQTDLAAINVASTYTAAWTAFTLKSILDPATNKSEGSYRPFDIHAPEGCILNATSPAPVAARHIVGRIVCSAILDALAPALPDQIIADCGSNPDLICLFSGIGPDGLFFTSHLNPAGGMGASSQGDGLPCASFPSNNGPPPIEVMESVAPLIVWKREIRQDSGGAGTFRGGYGQELIVEVSSPNPVTLSIFAERTNYSFPGLFGGHDGASLGINKLNGEGPSLPSKGIAQLMPGDIVQLLHGGGGGYGPPEKRDLRMVQADLRNEIISPEEAESKYHLTKRQRDLKVK